MSNKTNSKESSSTGGTTSTINTNNILRINDNLILSRDNLNEITKLPQKNALDTIFKDSTVGKNKERSGDVLFETTVPVVEYNKVTGKEKRSTKKVCKVVTEDVERFLISLIQDKEIDVEDRKFLLDLLLIAFDQYIIGVIKSKFKTKLSVVNFEDVQQSFRKGLVDSIYKYDLNHKERVRLTTFSYNYLIKELNVLLNKASPVNNSSNKVASKIKTRLLTLSRTKNEVNHKELIDIAEELGTTVKNVKDVVNSLSSISLNQSIDDEENNELVDTLSDYANNEEEVILAELANNLRLLTIEFINNIEDEKERFIFIFRNIFSFILENDYEEFAKFKELLMLVTNNGSKEPTNFKQPTLKYVGETIDLSAERVRQIQEDLNERYSNFIKQHIPEYPLED